jgi:EAL domain-containing protein (putative c-di-GMP-specific phosphodiesterase class I)/CheY-like chemotaxis protein
LGLKADHDPSLFAERLDEPVTCSRRGQVVARPYPGGFTVSLETEPIARVGSYGAAAVSATSSAKKGRVLIADDEHAVVRAYQRILAARGFEVRAATDGVDAKSFLEREEFDVILSDVHMPGMTGIDLLRAAREVGRDVPVILITGGSDDEFAELASEYGALLYLVKPVDARVMVQVVEHAIRLHRTAEAKRGAGAVPEEPTSTTDADRGALSDRFSRALAALRIAYQPIVDWRSRSLYGYEALVRSDEPALALPLALLDAAETLGRMIELGRAIRARVASTIHRAPERARIFVNLHPIELSDPEVLSRDAPLSQHSHRVVLEITERASLDRMKNVFGHIAELRRMGFQIAVDDLGAGYSGLSALARLMPELVKLDLSLIRDVHKEPMKRELIRHMAQLCTETGILVVAEGVETTAERDTLDVIGCTLMQGYLFGKPMQYFQSVVF